jgi:hypothetical protein
MLPPQGVFHKFFAFLNLQNRRRPTHLWSSAIPCSMKGAALNRNPPVELKSRLKSEALQQDLFVIV